MARFDVTEETREPVLEWLKERSQFSIWFTSLVTACFVVLTVFGNKPGFDSGGQQCLSAALLLMLLAILCNFVCVWSIPGWRLRIAIQQIHHTRRMYLEIAVCTWIAVVLFVAGLTLGMLGNLAA